jgi:hypothetical protein
MQKENIIAIRGFAFLTFLNFQVLVEDYTIVDTGQNHLSSGGFPFMVRILSTLDINHPIGITVTAQ